MISSTYLHLREANQGMCETNYGKCEFKHVNCERKQGTANTTTFSTNMWCCSHRNEPNRAQSATV